MMTIAVTGGAGLIGSALVWALNRRGMDRILVVDVLRTDERWKNLACLRFADYMDRDAFLSALESGKLNGSLEGILHMGACSSTMETDTGFLMQNNFEYTKRLALWCAEYNKRFVYASSAATYGNGEKGFSDDHSRLNEFRPLNGYAFSKWTMDLWALRMGLLDRIAGLKYFNVFGPNEYHKEDMRSVVLKTFEQITQSGHMRLFKSHRPDYRDGGQLRDFVYVKDAAAATLAIYENPRANGIFNVGTGKARSFYDLAATVFHAMDRPLQVNYIDMPESIREKYQYYTCAETAKLKTVYSADFQLLESAVTEYVQTYLLPDSPYLDPQIP